VHKVPQDGGTPLPVTTFDSGLNQDAHYWPEFLPDGSRFLYFARSRFAGKSGIAIGSIEADVTHQTGTPFLYGNSRPVYARSTASGIADPGGYVLFVRDGSLMAQPFDERRLTTAGEAHAIAERVALVGNFGLAYVSAGRNVLAYLKSEDPHEQLAWVNLDGHTVGYVGPPGEYSNPRLSPDETRVAVQRTDPATGVADVWILDLLRSTSTRFAFDRRSDSCPVWSPDGKHVVFSSDRHGPASIYRKPTGGVGDEQRLTEASYIQMPGCQTADGKLLYSEFHPETGIDIWLLEPDAATRQTALLRTNFNEMQPQVSPDGKFIAYASDESSRFEIYVQPFPELSARWQISTAGGQQPVWRRDGKRLYYVAPAGELMAIDFEGARPEVRAGNPQRLLSNRGLASADNTYRYDVSFDGTRFLIPLPVGEPPADLMTVVVNWSANLTK
jgi:dipeptidyl aminopeptidase/acylaminoacyl peptidase